MPSTPASLIGDGTSMPRRRDTPDAWAGLRAEKVLLTNAFIQRRIGLLLIALASLTLVGCETPPGCEPVNTSTGGWPVQCSGIASLRPKNADRTVVSGALRSV